MAGLPAWDPENWLEYKNKTGHPTRQIGDWAPEESDTNTACLQSAGFWLLEIHAPNSVQGADRITTVVPSKTTGGRCTNDVSGYGSWVPVAANGIEAVSAASI